MKQGGVYNKYFNSTMFIIVQMNLNRISQWFMLIKKDNKMIKINTSST